MQSAPPLQKDRLDSCSLFHTVSLWVQEKTEGLSPPSKGIARGRGEGPVTPPLKAFSYHIGKTQSGGYLVSTLDLTQCKLPFKKSWQHPCKAEY